MKSKGLVAQLGERRVRNAEVEGSNPFGSILVSGNFIIYKGSSVPAPKKKPNIPVYFLRHIGKHSSAGMSVRLTRERSWVRAPLLPLLKVPCLRYFFISLTKFLTKS